MDKRLKRQAALYVLIRLVDESEGFIDIHSDEVINSFSDEDQIVKAKLEEEDGMLMAAEELLPTKKD